MKKRLTNAVMILALAALVGVLHARLHGKSKVETGDAKQQVLRESQHHQPFVFFVPVIN